MKTVVKIIIDQIKEHKEVCVYEMEKNAMDECIELLETSLDKEKQQIIDAVKYGQNNSSLSVKHEEEIAKKYYAKTFEKK